MAVVRWNAAQINRLFVEVPMAAHRRAVVEAAGAAARVIRSKRSGELARDISSPEPLSPMVSRVGSRRVYAHMEDEGGTIRVRNAERMLIRDVRGGTRSDFGGDIVASAESVEHEGKHFTETARVVYVERVMLHLRAGYRGIA